MARNQVRIDAPVEAVFDVLLDAERYPDWVVGAKRIRHVESEWPAVGSGFHHTVGVGPAVLHDETRITEVHRPHRLVLDARARPSGRAEVRFELEAVEDGRTLLTMEEEPVSGPASWAPSRLVDPLIHQRNKRVLRLLKGIAEHETR
jgi:uncharacterized protein YndB with AHSA1/START domain